MNKNTLITLVVISSYVEKVYEVFSDAPTHIKPAFSTNCPVVKETGTENDTVAVAAVLERGTYPIFLAKETTFSLKVAESKKDSLTIMLELNAVM